MEEPITNVRVKLSNRDGNAYSILSKVRKALIDAGYKDLADEYVEAATQGTYSELLQTTMRFVYVD